MPPDLAEVQEWLRKAVQDRRMAEAGLALTPPVTNAAAFHCQQAVEKQLKAYLVYREVAFEKTHDLESLAGQCAQLDPAWEGLRDNLEPLSTYAIRFRYPGPVDPTVDEVRQALRVVDEVWQFVTGRLPPEVVPTDQA
jgi:HEPN domain-containing protein